MEECMPPELLAKIFSFLDPVDVFYCRQVCRRWRAVAIKIANPLYIPKIVSVLMQKLHSIGTLDDTLTLRLTCKLWKDGLDKLTLHENLLLKGVTNIESLHNCTDELIQLWNPFPSRIVRLKLCFGHDNPEDVHQLENEDGNSIMERFGVHVHFLQVRLQHANCAVKHLVNILNCLLTNIKGLVVSECMSPYRFANRKNTAGSTTDTENKATSSTLDDYELGQLERLTFLKLDDSDCKLKYSDLYKRIIENAPNLRHLEINGYHHLDIGIIKLLAYRVSCKMCLTHLKMDAESPDTQEILEILNKSELPLKYFSLKINGFGDASECVACTSLLHASLEKFGHTLERLELKLSWFERGEDWQPALLFSFPSSESLLKVNRFKLVGYKGQLDFLRDLPMLRSLMIVDYNPESQHIFDSEQSFRQLLPKLKELYVPLQGALYTADFSFKKKLQNFMYEEHTAFIPKYCGLYQEIFP